MEYSQGRYTLVQYCPVPERLEFLNIGLALVVPSRSFVKVRLAQGDSRIVKLFGKQSKSYLDAIKASFAVRLRDQLESGAERFEEFSAKRANEIRVSRLLPIQVQDVEADFERLFNELVGDDRPRHREPRMRRKLREAFVKNKVEQFLDKPEDVALPEYGLTVSVPYGYQNGCYNLIDGMRMPADVNDGLREAGKRSMEGGLIWKHFSKHDQKRLVVVGDFKNQPNEFYHAVRSQFDESNVDLYRLDDLRPLLNDIVANAKRHGRIHLP
jgi:Protein of unknown function (DUF3037)